MPINKKLIDVIEMRFHGKLLISVGHKYITIDIQRYCNE